MIEDALDDARDLWGCVAIASLSSRVDLRWARSTLTTNGEARSLELTVIAFVQQPDGIATASVSRTRPDRRAIRDMVAEARRAAEQASPADDACELLGQDSDIADQDWIEEPPVTSSDVFSSLSAGLGALFDEAGAQGIEAFGYAEHTLDTVWLGTSTGIRRRHTQPAGRLEITAKSHGRTRSTWWGEATDDFRDTNLDDALRSIRQALGWQERRIEVSPGRHTCLLTPSALGDLMVDLWWSMSARPAVEGQSAFSGPRGGTRLGEQLSQRHLTLMSDPHDPVIGTADWLATSGSSDMASVFDNGMSIQRTPWIEQGALTHLMASRSFGRDHSLPAIAPADTLRLDDAAGRGSTDDLLRSLDDGLYLTCLWYNRLVDPQTLLLTGLTRDGVYVVKGGEVIGATSNFRFNDSPLALLSRLSEMGQTERTLPREMGDYAPRVAMPPAVIEGFNLSTVSDAL